MSVRESVGVTISDFRFCSTSIIGFDPTLAAIAKAKSLSHPLKCPTHISVKRIMISGSLKNGKTDITPRRANEVNLLGS